MHLAYADRGAYIGNPEFVEVPMESLLHPEYIPERAALVSMKRANPEVEPGNPWKYQNGTGNKPAALEGLKKRLSNNRLVVQGNGSFVCEAAK